MAKPCGARAVIRAGSWAGRPHGQLALTLKFAPTPALRAVPAGNRWCPGLEQVPAFRQFVAECEATKAVLDEPILGCELRCGNAE